MRFKIFRRPPSADFPQNWNNQFALQTRVKRSSSNDLQSMSLFWLSSLADVANYVARRKNSSEERNSIASSRSGLCLSLKLAL